MAHPRHTPRHSRRRPPVFDGDFDDGQAVTVILRAAPEPPAWDGGPWEGASVTAVLPAPVLVPPPPDPVPEPPAPPRGPDTAFFDRTPAGWVLVCGLCPRDDPARPPMAYFDPSAGDAWHLFGTIRAAAYAAGWSVDLYGQWACGRCQATSRFRTARHADCRHPGAPRARAAGDYDAESRLRAFAEHDMIRRTAGTTGPGAAS